MIQRLFSRLIFWIGGWKLSGEFPKDIKKAVMAAAPHTSNWDFLYARCAFYLLRVPMKFTIKSDWMKFPFGPFVRAFGGIGIKRKHLPGEPKQSMTEAMIDLFNNRDELVVLVTPEGTRKYVEKWKTGFYYVALGAGVPIVLGFLDYKKKIAGIGPTIYPTGDVEKDIESIQAFYRNKSGKYPELGVK